MARGKTDVVILGGGVIALACAYFLNRAGRSVQILERHKLGSGSSAGNCGLITPSHAEPVCSPGAMRRAFKWMFNPKAPLLIRPQISPFFWRWAMKFARNCREERTRDILAAKVAILNSSRKLTEKLIDMEQLDCGWGAPGMLAVCLYDETLEELQNFATKAAEEGIGTETLDRETLRAREPALRERVCGAVLFRDDALLRPERFTGELARLCKERGVLVAEECDVQALNADADGLHSAYTNRGLYEADQFILAAGAWSPRLMKPLNLRIPVVPGKGYSLTTRRPDICPRYPLLLEEASMAVTPWEDGYRIGGTMEFSGYDVRLNKKRLYALIEGARRYLVEPLASGQPEGWFGFRPMTPDDLPLIGRAPGYGNLWLATGHNMLGMSMAVATGRLTAELMISREPHIDPTPYAPSRFSDIKIKPLPWKKAH